MSPGASPRGRSDRVDEEFAGPRGELKITLDNLLSKPKAQAQIALLTRRDYAND
jgi:hypothetical protein